MVLAFLRTHFTYLTGDFLVAVPYRRSHADSSNRSYHGASAQRKAFLPAHVFAIERFETEGVVCVPSLQIRVVIVYGHNLSVMTL